MAYVLSHTGYHFEFLVRRLADDHVEFLAQDGEWERIEGDMDPVQYYLAGYVRRFEGPLQTEKFIGNEPNVKYIVYTVDINPQR